MSVRSETVLCLVHCPNFAVTCRRSTELTTLGLPRTSIDDTGVTQCKSGSHNEGKILRKRRSVLSKSTLTRFGPSLFEFVSDGNKQLCPGKERVVDTFFKSSL